MSNDKQNLSDIEKKATINFAIQSLRMVCISLPYLVGLVQQIRINVDDRIQTIGIFASGRLVISPSWFLQLSLSDATFIMAHELMHLVLQTHNRSDKEQARLVNIAHDYIINDILSELLDKDVPANGLVWEGARFISLEELIIEIKKRINSGYEVYVEAWNKGYRSTSVAKNKETETSTSSLALALKAAGLTKKEKNKNESLPQAAPEKPFPKECFDVLSDELEREWFPETNITNQIKCANEIRQASVKAVSLKLIKDKTEPNKEKGDQAGNQVVFTKLLNTFYQPPWELALQRWMENVVPQDRTYSKASRRNAGYTDIVLPGRKREGWVLNIILDTSGSMEGTFGTILGIIASFCNLVNVGQIRLLQCDTEVTSDDFLSPEQLHTYKIEGLGGSDMSPAMLLLAKDPEVEAVIVLTDGYIDFPSQTMPYQVLWVLTENVYLQYFKPTYGKIIFLPKLS
jgi:predicted metal-dependent peptidase